MRSRGVRVAGEGAMAGHAPTVILLRTLGSHGQVRGSSRTHASPHGAKREKGGEGGGVADAGEIDLGRRVAQRRSRRILVGRKIKVCSVCKSV